MSKAATKAEKMHMQRVAELGCLIRFCGAPATIHHCGTFMGGGRNHMRVIPLCERHHLFGPDAIDGKMISKRAWEAKFGTEKLLLEKTQRLLTEAP